MLVALNSQKSNTSLIFVDVQSYHFVRNYRQNSESRSNTKQNDGSGQKYKKQGHAHSGKSENPQFVRFLIGQ